MNIFLSIFLLVAVISSNSSFFTDQISVASVPIPSDLVEYDGPVQHIFVHSLIIYPEKAEADLDNATGYRDNMITVKQFKEILEQLHDHNFILINSDDLYSITDRGELKPSVLRLPPGKKPLILSLDDLSYYPYMRNGGFANKLVLDNGIVKTEVITPEGNKMITEDGDAVPIVDQFVKEHPDFSLHGAKGIIAVTGFEGILGYRTQSVNPGNQSEIAAVVPVVGALKESGWDFASHSFTHNQIFLRGTITSEELAKDILKWQTQVGTLVGPTNIFIGPFGQVFTKGDGRRQQLIDAGFQVFYGVGMDGAFQFLGDHLVMNRIDIDGLRLRNSPEALYRLFGISVK